MKILVVHPGTQHSTKLTAAIKNAGHTVKLVTTVYYKKHTWLYLFMSLLPDSEKKRIKARQNKDLNEHNILVFSEILGLLLLVLARFDKSKKYYVRLKRIVASHVGRKAAKYAIKHKYDVVISFDSYALYPFSLLNNEKSGIIKVLDCSAAYAPYARSVYKNVIKKYTDQRNTLMSERCVIWNEKYYKDMINEAHIADKIICASNYTKNTLLKYGVEPKNVFVIPYGYDCPKSIETNKSKNEVFSILYVGNVSVMKGIPNLINAFKQIANKNVELILVGNISQYIYELTKDDHRIKTMGFVPHNELGTIYSKADLFVFPSYSDGFGFAPLEAMSYSVPCIVSKDSGISDVIVTGKNGFVIKSNSDAEIKKSIEWCISNKAELSKIGLEARNTALSYSNERYVESLRSFINTHCI